MNRSVTLLAALAESDLQDVMARNNAGGFEPFSRQGLVILGALIILTTVVFLAAFLILRRSRRNRRRRRRGHRPRNPTLAETGGLPPPRGGSSTGPRS